MNFKDAAIGLIFGTTVSTVMMFHINKTDQISRDQGAENNYKNNLKELVYNSGKANVKTTMDVYTDNNRDGIMEKTNAKSADSVTVRYSDLINLKNSFKPNKP